jgi:hypothetical protein
MTPHSDQTNLDRLGLRQAISLPAENAHDTSHVGGVFRMRDLRSGTLIDPQLAMFRMAMLPPKTPADTTTLMRAAFKELWTDRAFLADYTRVMKTEPVLVTGDEGQKILAEIGAVPAPIKEFLVEYSTRLTSK